MWFEVDAENSARLSISPKVAPTSFQGKTVVPVLLVPGLSETAAVVQSGAARELNP